MARLRSPSKPKPKVSVSTPPQTGLTSKERLNLFATPVLVVRHPDLDALICDLKTTILAKREESEGIVRSNQGGWHSNADFGRWAGPAGKTLLELAGAVARDATVDTGDAKFRAIRWTAEAWANVNEAGDSNTLHCHPGAMWSAVFYVDVGGRDPGEGGGELMLEDPRYPMTQMNIPEVRMKTAEGRAQSAQHVLSPADGLLVVFPSWLRHSVTPHKGDRPRISIAINYSIERRWAPGRGPDAKRA